jgi:flagellin
MEVNMPFSVGNSARIGSNTPASIHLKMLRDTNRELNKHQLNISTGKQINNASDDVANYPTSRILRSRNSTLQSAMEAVADAGNVVNIILESYDNIVDLVTEIKNNAAQAASGVQGTDEKIALSKAAYRLASQIQTVVDSSVFGGRSLIDGSFSANFVISVNASNSLQTLTIDMGTANPNFNTSSGNFDINSMNISNFAGVTGLDLRELDLVNSTDLGIFTDDKLALTLTSLSHAIDNITNTAAYVGGYSQRLESQAELLTEQITGYKDTISRIEDADVAREQLELTKKQFMQQTALYSLTQANVSPQSYLRLLE